MPADTKQLTADEVLERLNVMSEFSQNHAEQWRNQVADDLNQLMGRAVYWLETDGDTTDAEFGNAVLRIVERVAEFEEIVAKGKPSV